MAATLPTPEKKKDMNERKDGNEIEAWRRKQYNQAKRRKEHTIGFWGINGRHWWHQTSRSIAKSPSQHVGCQCNVRLHIIEFQRCIKRPGGIGVHLFLQQ